MKIMGKVYAKTDFDSYALRMKCVQVGDHLVIADEKAPSFE
jgi:hypothetical protein